VKASDVPMSRVADVQISIGEHRVRRGASIATFAERVRGRRLERGLSRAALAAAAGVSHDTLVNVERGQHEPRAYTLAAIADALETTMDALWHGAVDTSGHNDQNG
jgi:DNA-binding XRE family transcriptional regulator